jgi:hypothetical protein
MSPVLPRRRIRCSARERRARCAVEGGGAACEEMACLDEASTSAFVKHAVRLQGLKDVSEVGRQNRPVLSRRFFLPSKVRPTIGST